MRKFTFTYRVQILAAESHASLWLPIAHDDEFQRVTELAIDAPVEYSRHVEPQNGNHMVYLRLPPDSQSREVRVHYRVERRIRRSRQPSDAAYAGDIAATPLARYLEANSQVPIDGQFARTAGAIASREHSPRERARRVFDYLLENLEYDSRGCTYDRNMQLGDLPAACELGCGTCTEFHGLFTSYARALGLPVRMVFGFNIPRNRSSGSIAGYHCWAEVYLPEVEWFPIDVSEAFKRDTQAERDYYFGNLNPDRVQFTRGRDVDLVPVPGDGPVDKFIFPIARFDGDEGGAMQLWPSFEFTDLES